MTDNTEALPPLPQRWTTGDASTSEAGGFVAYSDYLELRRATLAQRQQVPEGWVLVPKKPTPEMVSAGRYAYEDKGWNGGPAIFSAMLAAAPALTAAPSAQAEPQEGK